MRGLPKVVWVFVILLFPYAGPAGWWFAGRPKAAPYQAARCRDRTGEPQGPDDDPDFLRNL